MSSTLSTPPGYAPFDLGSLRRWLAGRPDLAARLGGEPEGWRVDEVGDGNLNLVFLARGPAGGLCIKQSLPYVRVAGESWPLPLERAWFEQRHLADTGAVVDGLAPRLISYDPVLFAVVMELLPHHKILRLALADGERHDLASHQVADYAARATFHTSVLARPFEAVADLQAVYARNQALTRISVDLIFTDPYTPHERNRWTSPQLDDLVADIRGDVDLKRVAARLGHAFLTRHEALLHGDLHSGSVMVARLDGSGVGRLDGSSGRPDDTRVIDPEFALFGPIGFDLGAYVANLLMAYFSQPGHEQHAGDRAEHAEWILSQVGVFWRHFASRFDALWLERLDTTGQPADAWPPVLFEGAAGRAALAGERRAFLDGVYTDLVGYTGVEIIRRTIGFAHNLDFERIANPERRADCERRALRLARRLMLEPQAFADITLIEQAARDLAR
ncbi:MAG: methylthioribose kinase [Pseudomonadota bacterium]|jgi:5-methylthioribose kinase